MPTTKLPAEKTKAHEIAQKIANQRPLRKDREAPDANVTGGFNQKRGDPPVPGREDGDTDRND
jgi:hypothetical protein